jgi:SRSO17 transposase
MEWNRTLWQRSIHQLAGFLEPLTAKLGRSERREGTALYVRGLLMPGERKSIEPMAERLGVDKQKLQQLMADSPWDDQEVWHAIRRNVVPAMEPLAAWIVDETGWLKQGKKSVGVARQYCGAVGKNARCQVSVEVVVTDGEIAAPVAGRLYLSEDWAGDQTRRDKAGVPQEVQFQTKLEIALELLKQVKADGVSPAPVLGDEAYGRSGEFRRSLRQMGLEYFLNANSDAIAWSEPVTTHRTKKHWVVTRGQTEHHSLAELSQSINETQWQAAAWHAADGTKRQTRIAWLPVYVLTDLDDETGEWPQTWLVVDWPEGDAEPYHLYLAWLKTEPVLIRCLRLSRGRFAVEQYFQRGKTDLGLDHYEGRSWRGFHHHLALAPVAYLFVMIIYLRRKKNFWCYVGEGTAHDAAVVSAVDRPLPVLRNTVSTEPSRSNVT